MPPATARILTLFLVALSLSACVGPMGQREAQMIAGQSLRRFCRDQPCGTTHLVAAQKLKDRWLLDYDAPANKYAVIVDAGGNAQVSVWDKSQAGTAARPY